MQEGVRSWEEAVRVTRDRGGWGRPHRATRERAETPRPTASPATIGAVMPSENSPARADRCYTPVSTCPRHSRHRITQRANKAAPSPPAQFPQLHIVRQEQTEKDAANPKPKDHCLGLEMCIGSGGERAGPIITDSWPLAVYKTGL